MKSDDSQDIIALTILYLLYAAVPILLFVIFLLTGFVYFLIIDFLVTRQYVALYNAIVYLCLELALIIITYKLVKWLRE